MAMKVRDQVKDALEIEEDRVLVNLPAGGWRRLVEGPQRLMR
ncbi:MAG: hypothetical protein AAB308_11685 [Nitrospirota bacterium]